MRKYRWPLRIAVIVVVMAAIGYFYGDSVLTALRPPDEEANLTSGELLTLMTVKRGTISHHVTASGNLRPRREVTMHFDEAGRIEEVYVGPGDRVTQGMPLVRLNNRQQELGYMKAKTNYEIALIDSPPNVIQEREYDMEVALESLERTILRAPFDGLITEVAVETGETVSTSNAILNMIDDSAYEVDIAVDELDVNQLRIGQRAVIFFDADRDHPRTGVVQSIGWTADVQGNMVTVPVKVRLDEVDPSLRPGYTSTVQITVAEAKDAIVIPVEAINDETGTSLVTKVVDGEPIPVPVQTGITDGMTVEIVSGLQEGDEIVSLNYRGARGGQTMPGGSSQNMMRGFGGGVPTFRLR